MNLLGLLFDGGLAILLVVTIGYCSRLSKRIRLLQDGRSELAGMIAQFDQATGRAVTSFAELQSVSKRITEALQLKIDKANFLADDLAFFIEKSSRLVSQLEQANAQRKAEAAAPRPQPATETQSFFKAATGPAKPKLAAYKPSTPQAAVPSSVTSAASLEALLSRLASGTGAASSASLKTATAKPQPLQAPRTDAERELLEALKPGR
jgi:hypothetical protein